MILSFRDKELRQFYLENRLHRRIPADITNRLFRKLQLLDDASCDLDLRSPPSNHFEKLSGNLVGKCSIRVNRQWRLIFEWDGQQGCVINLYLDNHSYR